MTLTLAIIHFHRFSRFRQFRQLLVIVLIKVLRIFNIWMIVLIKPLNVIFVRYQKLCYEVPRWFLFSLTDSSHTIKDLMNTRGIYLISVNHKILKIRKTGNTPWGGGGGGALSLLLTVRCFILTSIVFQTLFSN